MNCRRRTSSLVGTLLIAISFIVGSPTLAALLLPRQPPMTSKAPNTCPTTQPAPDFPAVSNNYARKYNTIAHKFLDDEKGAGNVTPQMYALLDGLIDEGIAKLKPYAVTSPADQAKSFAVDTLDEIDCILLSHGFVYPGIGLVQLLSDGLDPTLYDIPQALHDLKFEGHNERRAKFIEARGKGPFHVVDCDIASFIYLAITEVMKYPLHLVTIPSHNFVRWQVDKDNYIDYETMDGETYDDDHYVGFNAPAKYAHADGALRSLSAVEAFAYHDIVVALAWSWHKNYDRMTYRYVRSIRKDPVPSQASNNLAWFYATAPGVLSNGKKAIKYALLAEHAFPNADVLDTLACAYVRKGDFQNAALTAMKAKDSDYGPGGGLSTDHEAAITAHRPCTDPKFGQGDPKPFRPHVAYPSHDAAPPTTAP